MSYLDAEKSIAYNLINNANLMGITKAELGKRVGVAPSAISKIYYGKQRLTLADFLALCEAANFSQSVALTWQENPAAPEEIVVRGRTYRLVG